MQKRLGVEATIKNLFTAEFDNGIVDKDGELLIFESSIQLLPSNIETYSLLELENPERTDLFNDYGFISEQGRTYLYQETVIAFSIVEGDATEIAMALLQYEEYLIAKEHCNNEIIYFMDKTYEDLIKKVAAAYDINIHIFDLDK
ncbi:hypothetical protein HNQ85_000160 [Anoxybacillus calidus]|jgi:hypothetical protein|uniref:Uncharacterized protein n=1 Tax=[Anoxybacillus] calidus TaxID=575178 RepID=A0A7V9YWU3_9BACL|nr:hypothetical protein [Anoxybacillus calidus]MBA2869902.1 hypothetical protein [Anoxybacillus calidus]